MKARIIQTVHHCQDNSTELTILYSGYICNVTAGDDVEFTIEKKCADVPEYASVCADCRGCEKLHITFSKGYMQPFLCRAKSGGGVYPDSIERCPIPSQRVAKPKPISRLEKLHTLLARWYVPYGVVSGFLKEAGYEE